MKKTFLLLAATCCLVINTWSVDYDISIAGIEVTDANKNAITGTGITGKVSYNSETKTLTLDNAKIEHTGSDMWSGAIKTEIALTINCIGENTIEGKGDYCPGIANYKDLTFEGTGKLSVKGGCGIFNQTENSAITIANCEVTVEGINDGAISPYSSRYYKLFVDKGTLLAKGNGTYTTIQGCSSLTMTGVDFLTETTWDATNKKFKDKSGNVSRSDIKIGPKSSTYTITATATNGTVVGGGEYAPGATVTLGVIPNDGYEFTEWSDGSKDNPYTFTATKDVTLEATCSLKKITVTTSAVNGTVVGGGEFNYGATVTLGAIPNQGYEFSQWSDGATANPYIFTATKDVTLEAVFKEVGDGLDEVTGDRLQVTGSRKVLRNGQLLIIREGEEFNAMGVKL